MKYAGGIEINMNETYQKYYADIEQYVLDRADGILKEPHSFIHYPFIDPGSVYDGNVWDWDSYWSVYGLLPIAKKRGDAAFLDRVIEHAKGNVRNFFDHQLEDGYIPMMIEVADWPEPYLNMKHKEGIKMNMHKPFLATQICLISDFVGDYSWAAPYADGLAAYFRHYRENYFNENAGLYVWHDDIMIGMDNDPASFGRPKDSTANIFLNSFMVRELEAYEKYLREIAADGSKEDKESTVCEEDNEKEGSIVCDGSTDGNAGCKDAADCQNGNVAEAEKIAAHREALIKAIQDECYDQRDQFFYSVDVDIKTRKFDWFHQGLGVFWKTLPIKIRVWSGFLPMAVGIATPQQAESLVAHWKDEKTFYSPYGIATLAKDEKMFDLSVTNNPSNWLGPIWLVANYLVFSGFLRYGYLEEARTMCENTLTLLGQDLEKTGELHEYYNPFNGEPIMNGGFVNWNMLALNMVDELEAYEKA